MSHSIRLADLEGMSEAELEVVCEEMANYALAPRNGELAVMNSQCSRSSFAMR